MLGFPRLYVSIMCTTVGVATFGFVPTRSFTARTSLGDGRFDVVGAVAVADCGCIIAVIAAPRIDHKCNNCSCDRNGAGGTAFGVVNVSGLLDVDSLIVLQ